MADAFVVDTFVFARWFLEQVGYEHACEVRARFLVGAVQLETVDCVRFELSHVLRKRPAHGPAGRQGVHGRDESDR